MNHGLKILNDKTLVLTLPKEKEVGRILVEWSGTQLGTLFYPETVSNCIGCIREYGEHIACRSCSRRFVDKYVKGES